MKRVFMTRSPRCKKAFVVDWELRFFGRQLICPFCQQRFLPADAASLDEPHRG
jgi:hypothetical protein